MEQLGQTDEVRKTPARARRLVIFVAGVVGTALAAWGLYVVFSSELPKAAQSTSSSASGISAEQPPKRKLVTQRSETVLCQYRKDVMGAFSPHWVAYIIEPAKEATDSSRFVEVNGKRLGPYTQVSGMMELSRDGRHLAFAAEKNGKWVVVVDGVEKYTHEALLWPWCAWSPTLEGNSFIPQTQAAVLEFSPDGQSIAYPAKLADGKYAVFVDGKPGKAYNNVGARIQFVAGRVKYYAFPEEKKLIEVHGDAVFGPYDESYKTKVSANGQHYCFWAASGTRNIFVADGRTHELPGKVLDYCIGNDGLVVYAYKVGGRCRVRVGTTDLPGEYDEVTQLTLSPDGKKAAFWARSGGKWSLLAGDKVLPGFDGYFYYDCGGKQYSVMWSADSQHVAYYIRDGHNGILVLDGQKLEQTFRPSGIAMQVIVDEKGQTVGTGMMSAPRVDSEAFVQAVLMRETAKCDPFTASLCGQSLCYIEKRSADATFMHVGDKAEGPYRNIRSVLLTSAGGRHYAYIVEAENGQQLVIDGRAVPNVFDAIYRPAFNDDEGALEFLAIKDGNVVRVVEPMAAK